MDMTEHIEQQGVWFSLSEWTEKHHINAEQSGIRTLSPTNSLKALTRDVLSEDACRHWILSQLHPDGIKCPKCTQRLLDETTVKNFWRGRRCHCKKCGKRFFPTEGTVLHKSRISMRQTFTIAVLIALGVSNKQVADIVGITPDSVRIWRMKLNV